MIILISLLTTFLISHALDTKTNEITDVKVKEVFDKHLQNVTDIENEYVINEKLSRAISNYFKGKLSMFPLYKINLKIDRNPVKIPWTLGKFENNTLKKRRYKYVAEPATIKPSE